MESADLHGDDEGVPTTLVGEHPEKKGPHRYGKGNPGGPGRKKGGRNKTALLREQLAEMKWCPLIDLHKLMRKQNWSKTDEKKAMILKELAVQSTPREKINENHNTDDRTLTITHNYSPMTKAELDTAYKQFGVDVPKGLPPLVIDAEETEPVEV